MKMTNKKTVIFSMLLYEILIDWMYSSKGKKEICRLRDNSVVGDIVSLTFDVSSTGQVVAMYFSAEKTDFESFIAVMKEHKKKDIKALKNEALLNMKSKNRLLRNYYMAMLNTKEIMKREKGKVKSINIFESVLNIFK